MKSIIASTIFFMLFLSTQAQTRYSSTAGPNISYKLIKNDPEPTIMSLNLDLFHFDMASLNLDAASLNIGLWGFFEVVPGQIGVTALYRRSIFALGRLGNSELSPNSELDLGGYYVLASYKKTRKTNVVLDSEYKGWQYSSDLGRTVDVTTTTSVVIPSDKLKQLAVRGGIYRRAHAMGLAYYDEDIRMNNGYEYADYNTFGFYAGIGQKTFTSIFIDAENYGVCYTSIGRNLYFDLLIMPHKSFTELETEKEISGDLDLGGPVGFRLGYQLFQSDPKKLTGKTFGMCGTAEAGIKPYTGIFASASIGISILKR